MHQNPFWRPDSARTRGESLVYRPPSWNFRGSEETGGKDKTVRVKEGKGREVGEGTAEKERGGKGKPQYFGQIYGNVSSTSYIKVHQ